MSKNCISRRIFLTQSSPISAYEKSMFLIAILSCLRLAGNTILAGNRFHKETMRTGNACARALILASRYNSLRGCPLVEVLPANLKKHVKRYINKTVNNFETQ